MGSLSSLWMPVIDQSTCTGCGECVAHCPENALGSRNGKAAIVRPDACSYCGACETLCPVGAIELPYLIVRNGMKRETQHAK